MRNLSRTAQRSSDTSGRTFSRGMYPIEVGTRPETRYEFNFYATRQYVNSDTFNLLATKYNSCESPISISLHNVCNVTFEITDLILKIMLRGP